MWRRLTEGGRTTAQSWPASLVLAADVAEFCAPVAARQISDVSLSRSRQLPAIDMVTGEIWVSRSPHIAVRRSRGGQRNAPPKLTWSTDVSGRVDS